MMSIYQKTRSLKQPQRNSGKVELDLLLNIQGIFRSKTRGTSYNFPKRTSMDRNATINLYVCCYQCQQLPSLNCSRVIFPSFRDSAVIALKELFSNLRQSFRRKKKRIKYLSTSEIDKISLYAFPFMFCLFNIIYWSYYWTRGQ